MAKYIVISPVLFLLIIWFTSTSASGDNSTISNITSNNYTLLTRWGTKGTADGKLMFPHSIAVASDGNALLLTEVTNEFKNFLVMANTLPKSGSEGTGDGQFKGCTIWQ